MTDEFEMRYIDLVAENARLRAALDEAREWLHDPKLAMWSYVESVEMYDDIVKLRATIDKAMGEG
jgi:hypothetical protein